MAIRIGRSCESCGFDNAEVGQDCPLCGLSATVAPSSDAPTLAMSETTSAVEFDPAQTPAVQMPFDPPDHMLQHLAHLAGLEMSEA